MLYRGQMAAHTKMMFAAFTSQVLWKQHHLASIFQIVHSVVTVHLLEFSVHKLNFLCILHCYKTF